MVISCFNGWPRLLSQAMGIRLTEQTDRRKHIYKILDALKQICSTRIRNLYIEQKFQWFSITENICLRDKLSLPTGQLLQVQGKYSHL